jgi:hypothetical protein
VASRPDLPLNEKQIVALASAPGWASLIDGLSRPAESPAAPSQAVLGKQTILDALDGALPSGVHAVRKGGSEKGYVDVLLDDGRTETLLTITVQDWPPQQEQLNEIFKNAKPDRSGNRLVTRQYPTTSGGRNAVEWDADALYGDGRRVVVSELNAMAFGLAAKRANPPLSMKQLASIAEAAALRS